MTRREAARPNGATARAATRDLREYAVKNPDIDAPRVDPNLLYAQVPLAGGFGHFSTEPAAEDGLDDDALAAAAAAFAAAPPALRPDPLAAGLVAFALHDICRAAWTAAAGPTGEPLSRDALDGALTNLRRGSLDLVSVYGAAGDEPAPALRDARDPALLGPAATVARNGARLPAPADAGQDPFAPWASQEGAALATPAPLLGDPRNAADPALRRLGLAAARLHNRAVPACLAAGAPRSALFRDARTELRLLVQWLLLNDALPALVPPGAVEAALEARAPMYMRFAARRGRGVPPLPLDALAAAGPLLALHRERGAPDAGSLHGLMRLGRRLGAPSGQAALRAINAARGRAQAPLTDAELLDGPGAALAGASETTPLVAYLLREAAERGEDGRFGPLGGDILAETLAGIVLKDPMSYWARPGERGGRWTPADSEIRRADGGPILTVAQFLEAAGVD